MSAAQVATPSRTRWRGVTAARWWHGVVAAMTLTGVVWELFATLGRGPEAGDSTATLVVHFFSYFTILSNLLVGVTSAMLLVNPVRDGRVFRIARLDALLCIAVTGIVYNTVLAGLQELSVAPRRSGGRSSRRSHGSSTSSCRARSPAGTPTRSWT